MNTRRNQASQRAPSPRPHVSSSDWVETTTVRPRERPKAGRHLQVQQQPPQTVPAAPVSDYYQTIYHQAPTQNQTVTTHQNIGTVPVADILDLSGGSQASSMTRSLDSTRSGHVRTYSASPFGDDFSTLDPRLIHQSAGASSTPAGLNTAQPGPPTNHKQLGFEDSFADLDLSSTAVPRQSLVCLRDFLFIEACALCFGCCLVAEAHKKMCYARVALLSVQNMLIDCTCD